MEGLGGEEQRGGVKSSETILACPLTSEGTPLESSQHVHAFLPIRDFGFKVLFSSEIQIPSTVVS